jgi:PLP dependent protein
MYRPILAYCQERGVRLIVVSKNQELSNIKRIYDLGQRAFGENRVQDLMDKKHALPEDIEWHLIGTLQTNKVKYIAPFIHLIHSLDDESLWREINKQASKYQRTIPCLLQIKIARETTKSGFDWNELRAFLSSGIWRQYNQVKIQGVMGMASLTADQKQIEQEFSALSKYFKTLKASFFPEEEFQTLSMGMSSDYQVAIQCGATMVRVGSAIFESFS